MFSEICQRGRFYTICALPKINLVKVHIQDFVFRIFVFHLPGKKCFLDFTGNRTFLCQECVFGKLLRYRTATLYFLPHNVADQSAECAAVVNAAVIIETVIFN